MFLERGPSFYLYAVWVRILSIFRLLCACIALSAISACESDRKDSVVPSDPPPANAYTDEEATRDGIGRTYFGREIAQVMGHPAIYWLERNSREAEERTDVLMQLLGVKDGDDVADIGAGSGYFTLPLARAVSPSGIVFAVDIQPEMIEFLAARARTENVQNIKPILGKIDDICLAPQSVDLVLLVDAYHEFDHPWEMMRSIARALRPGGRVALVEYRGEDPEVPIKPLHKMTQEQARIELEAVGLIFERNDSSLPIQHLLWFRKPKQ